METAQADLALSIESTLFFAGEATVAGGYSGTVNGASSAAYGLQRKSSGCSKKFRIRVVALRSISKDFRLHYSEIPEHFLMPI